MEATPGAARLVRIQHKVHFRDTTAVHRGSALRSLLSFSRFTWRPPKCSRGGVPEYLPLGEQPEARPTSARRKAQNISCLFGIVLLVLVMLVTYLVSNKHHVHLPKPSPSSQLQPR
jgi:hypothetical protein